MANQFDYMAENVRKNHEEESINNSLKTAQQNLAHTPTELKNKETNPYREYVNKLLSIMKESKASDLLLTVGLAPSMKKNGELTPIPNVERLTPEMAENLVFSTMNEKQKNQFLEKNDLQYAISLSGVGRFRVSALRQRGSVAMVVRIINTVIPKIEELSVPEGLKKIIMEKRGLIIIVGATGSGKSTTLAAMLGYRNANHAGHIITIEDPIEFVHQHNKSAFTQREVGVDTESWESALESTLRQMPDVILIGEVRSRETMDYAIAFAETGHLCLCTLHANNANQALDRIINFFPEERKQQLLMDLSLNLKAIISQRLIPSATKGRAPAVEILINTPYVTDLIFKGEVAVIKEAMKKGKEAGMITFDQALFDLYESELISLEDALRNADSINDLKLNIKLNSKRGLGLEKKDTPSRLAFKED